MARGSPGKGVGCRRRKFDPPEPMARCRKWPSAFELTSGLHNSKGPGSPLPLAQVDMQTSIDYWRQQVEELTRELSKTEWGADATAGNWRTHVCTHFVHRSDMSVGVRDSINTSHRHSQTE
jgi:hypothetical protein